MNVKRSQRKIVFFYFKDRIIIAIINKFVKGVLVIEFNTVMIFEIRLNGWKEYVIQLFSRRWTSEQVYKIKKVYKMGLQRT